MRKTITSNSLKTFQHFGIVMILTLLSGVVRGQTSYTLKGTITDDTGETLPGATVQIEGTTYGTVTDFDGVYNFKADLEPGDYTLIIRSVGMTTKEINIPLGAQTQIVNNFEMAGDVLGLSEVVVTGTGALTEKRQLGNTISTVKGSTIQQAGSTDISAALSGKFAGVQVTQNTGDPAGGISVRLRGASTISGSSDPLYIVDGVIVNNNSVDVLGTDVVQNRLSDISPQDIDHIEVLKGAAAAAIYGSRASNGVVQIFTKRGKAGKPVVTVSSSVNVNSLRKKRDWNQYGYTWAEDGVTKVATDRYDYQDLIFQTGVGTDNYVSLSGGTDKTNYFSSISYMANEGIVKNTDYNRVSGRLRVNQTLSDWINVSFGTYVARSHSNDQPNGGNGTAGALTRFLFTDNIYDPHPDEDGNYSTAYFMEILDKYQFQQFNNRSISDFQVNIAPVDGLNIKYVLGYDNSVSKGTTYIPIGSTASSSGSAASNTVQTQLLNSDVNITYEKQINRSIKSTTGAGYTWQYSDYYLSSISATGLASGVTNINGASSLTSSVDDEKRSVWGGYVQQTFGFFNKMFVTGAIRMDGSSVFGKDQRNQLYPKVSASYLLSDEDFWKNSIGNVVNTFKLRAAWGQAGNLTAIGSYDRLTNYDAVSYDGSTGFVAPDRNGNSDLKPERQTEIEIGLDISMLNNRLGLELSYYDQDITDLLLDRTLAPSTGYTTRYENIGSMTNKGLEVMINAVPVQTKNLTWTVMGTYSRNRNKVYGIADDVLSVGNWGYSVAKNGEPLGVFYKTYYKRDEKGNLDLTDDGLPQAATDDEGNTLNKVIGNPNPNFVASLINQLDYKNFSFRMQLDAVQGNDVLSWDDRIYSRYGGSAAQAKELKGEVAQGTAVANYTIAESFIKDGSYIKVREVSIGYTFRNLGENMNNLKVTASGRNLFSFDNYDGWDPEGNMDGQSNGGRGGLMALTPLPRVIKLSVSATF